MFGIPRGTEKEYLNPYIYNLEPNGFPSGTIWLEARA